ncbi:hypothetical protein OOZ51_14340 [Arthrobacter sp. MI7-26]|nr:hypothetical protein [Arthrobacter sp. MI7-26]MCX2748984.1 hypothetical protein [Arthrobacter sp. MI7-26]
MSACRRPGGTSQENIRFVVGWIAVTAGGAFAVRYGGVVGFELAVGGAGNDQDLDFFPQPADGAVEPVRFRSCGCRDQFLEFFLGRGRVLQGAGAQQDPALFLDLPD